MMRRIPLLLFLFFFVFAFAQTSPPDGGDGDGTNNPGDACPATCPEGTFCDSTTNLQCLPICPEDQVADSFGTCCAVGDKDCNGDCFGTAVTDSCGICGGNDATKDVNGECCPSADAIDCAGICNGDGAFDDCGVCNGGNANKDENGVCCEQKGCDGICPDPATGEKVENDKCGVCGGDDSTCCGTGGACSNNGECSAPFQGCLCNLGWTGPFCSLPQDPCQNKDCSMRGHCEALDQTTGVCVCEPGYTGEHCELKSCFFRGEYNATADACVCEKPYDPATDCSACVPPEKSHDARLCYSVDGENFVPREIRKQLARALIKKGWQKHRTLNFTIIAPDSEFNGAQYDCGCQKVETLLVEGSSPLEARSATRGHSPQVEKVYCHYNYYLNLLMDQEESCDRRVEGYISGTIFAMVMYSLVATIAAVFLFLFIIYIRRSWVELNAKKE